MIFKKYLLISIHNKFVKMSKLPDSSIIDHFQIYSDDEDVDPGIKEAVIESSKKITNKKIIVKDSKIVKTKEPKEIKAKEPKEKKKNDVKVVVPVSDHMASPDTINNIKLIDNIMDNDEIKVSLGSVHESVKNCLLNMIKDISYIKNEISLIKEVYTIQTLKQDEIDAHISVIQKLVNERITSEQSESTKQWVPPDEKSANLLKNVKKPILKKFNDTYMIFVGRTFNFKHLISSVPGVCWNKDPKGWLVPINQISNLETNLSSGNIEFDRE